MNYSNRRDPLLFQPFQYVVSLICIILVLNLIPAYNLWADDTSSLQKGIDLYSEGKYSEARDVLLPIAKDDPEAAYYAGLAYYDAGDVDKAIKWLKKAIKLDEDKSEYYFALGNVYASKSQNSGAIKAFSCAKKLKKNFEKTVELDPGNLQARMVLLQFYMRAPGIVGGDKKRGRYHAEEIRQRDPNLGHLAFALIYHLEENYEKAEKEYLAVVAALPDSLDYQYALGIFYQEINLPDKAVETFESICELHPDELNALYQIGRTGALLGSHLDRAEECLLLYLQSEPGEDDPSLAWANYRLSMVYENGGNVEKAYHCYQTTLKLDPDHKEAKKALKKLK